MRRILDVGLPILTLVLMGIGSYWGLFVAPPEQFMGDVYRIIYVHVPSAWITMVAYLVVFLASLVYLFNESSKADAIADASAEIGVVFNALLLVTGSIWGKPTWGVWWSWDPRLTTAAIMFFAYAGYMAMRQFVEEPEKRSTWSAVVGVMIFVSAPITWFSVKWWNSLHQVQSNQGTMGKEMLSAFFMNLFAFSVLYLWLLLVRYRIARTQQTLDLSEPPELLDEPPVQNAASSQPMGSA